MRESYPIQNRRTAWRVYDGEAVVLRPDDSTLNTLNPAGTLIWESADGRTPLSAVVARICATFDVDAGEAARDAEAFVTALEARGLVTVSGTPEGQDADRPASHAGPTGSPAAPHVRAPYEPPRIRSEEVFETTALACRKVTGGRCGVSPKS